MTPSASLLRRLLDQPPPGLDHPVHLRFTPDGSALTYLQAMPGSNVRELWRHELADGSRRVVARPPERATRTESLSRGEELDRQRRRESGLGLTRYLASAHADLVTCVAAGRCLVARGGALAEQLPGWSGVQAALPSPDGGRLAIVAGGDLWIDALDGTRLQLTNSGSDVTFSGLAEYVAAEELDRFDGCWWSADGRAIAWASVDERDVTESTIGRSTGERSDEAPSERLRYPFAGGANARVSLWIAEAGGPARATPVDLPLEDAYLARVVADPTGGWLAAVLPRHQRTLAWWRVAVSGKARPIWEERGRPWINLDDATRVLSDGRILRATEETGFRHLELRTPDGAPDRRLTGGEWAMTALVHVDEDRGEALVIGTADGVLERHLYAVPLDAGEPVVRPRRLTSEAGWHAAVVAPDGSRWVDTWSDRRHAPAVTVRARTGVPELRIHEPSATAEGLGLVVPDLLELRANDGTTVLHGAILRPPRPAGVPPPAVVWVYGGPHSQNVREAWELTLHPLRQALARAGVAVLLADGRGTANRGTEFEAALDHALGSVEVDDQAAVVEQVATRGEIDRERIGITGGSYGGYMTVRAMLRRPDMFVVGVAVAPVVAWDGYDTAYTERYLGDPSQDPGPYRRASLLDEAGFLRGDLLVIHGTIDENVHPRHTERLLDALRVSGRPVQVLWLEGERHRTQVLEAALRRDRHVMAHLFRGLGVPPQAESAGDADAPNEPSAGEGIRRPRTAG